MTTPQHPLFVHLPLALAVLMPVVAAVLWFAQMRSWLPMRAWLLAVGGQLLLVGTGWLALRTGETDEDRVERLVPEAALELHEGAAKVFVAGAGAVFLLSLAPLLLRRRPRGATWGRAITTVGTLGVLALGYRVGEAGGELVYRHGAAAAFATGTSAPATAVAPRREHDDH